MAKKKKQKNQSMEQMQKDHESESAFAGEEQKERSKKQTKITPPGTPSCPMAEFFHHFPPEFQNIENPNENEQHLQ